MRVMQQELNLGWFDRSNDPATSLYAICAGGIGEYLVDDQRVFTRIADHAAGTGLGKRNAAVFWAKDPGTLARGFDYVAKHRARQLETNFTVRGVSNLSARALTWDFGGEIAMSKFAIVVRTVLFNIGELMTHGDTAGISPIGRKVIRAQPTDDGGEPFSMAAIAQGGPKLQSVAANLKRAGRDAKLERHGVALIICETEMMPGWGPPTNQKHGYYKGATEWGKEFPGRSAPP